MLNYAVTAQSKGADECVTRCEVADIFMPYVKAGAKVSDDYFKYQGVIFSGKYGYVINKNCIGRIMVDDRILPMQPLLWTEDGEEGECIEAPSEAILDIRKSSFSLKDCPLVSLRTKDLLCLVRDLTPKRESKSIVTLSIQDETVLGRTLRKNEIIAEKNFLAFKNHGFQGEIRISLFDFKKMLLEIFSDYDIIGVQSSEKQTVFYGKRLDRKKPSIDFLIRGGEK